jgi:hypothetical protein
MPYNALKCFQNTLKYLKTFKDALKHFKITKTSSYLKKISDLNERKFEISKSSRNEGFNVVFLGAEGTFSLNIRLTFTSFF